MNRRTDSENSIMELSDDHIAEPTLPSIVTANMPHASRMAVSKLENAHQPQSKNTVDEYTPIIKVNQRTRRLELSQNLSDVLNNRYPLKQILIVSVYGQKNQGKSFLLDSILSEMQGQTMRVFCKVPNDGCNIQTRQIYTANGRPILLLDWSGFDKNLDAMDEDTFLLIYSVSNLIVFNQIGYDLKADENFTKLCSLAKERISLDGTESTPPFLQIIRRDIKFDTLRRSNLVEEISRLQVFQPLLPQIMLPFPGNQKVSAKELKDAPKMLIEPQFIKKVKAITDIIGELQPKVVNDTIVNSNILSILTSSFVSSLNRSHRIVLEKCWSEVIENLSVGAYNYYILQYSEALEKEFSDQQPISPYQLYKKLNRVKNQTNFKLQSLANIRGDPIFEKYRQKLDSFIDLKQKLIIQINKAKSINALKLNVSQVRNEEMRANSENITKFKNIISKVSSQPNLTGKNQVLNETFQEIMYSHMKPLQSKADSTTLKNQLAAFTTEVAMLQKKFDTEQEQRRQNQAEIVRFKEEIGKKQQIIEKNEENIRTLDEEISRKRSQIQQQEKSQSQARQRERLEVTDKYESKISTQKQEIDQLQQKISDAKRARKEAQKKSVIVERPKEPIREPVREPPAPAPIAQPPPKKNPRQKTCCCSVM